MKTELLKTLSTACVIALFLNDASVANDQNIALSGSEDAASHVTVAPRTVAPLQINDQFQMDDPLQIDDQPPANAVAVAVPVVADAAPTPNESDWTDDISPTFTGPEMTEYAEVASPKIKSDWERVGGAGRILPSEETGMQRTTRRFKDTVVFGGELALPFLRTYLSLEAIEFVFTKVTPSAVTYLSRMSADSGSRDSSYWTRFVPGSDSAIRYVYTKTTRDEVGIIMSDLKDFTSNYSSAMIDGMCLATASLGHKMSSALSRVTSWFF